MSKSGNIKTILSFIFFGLGILFFALSIQKYQVKTSTRASEEKTVKVDYTSNTNFGTLDQSFGVIVPIDNTELVTEVDSKYKGTGMYIKIVEPTVDTIKSANFIKLANSAFNFYFSFETYDNIQSVLTEFKKTNVNKVVVEINKVENLDAAATDTLLTLNPEIKFHAPYMDFWPTDRNKVKEILAKVSPPKLDAISIHTWPLTPSDSIMNHVHLMFDTFFDASKDIGNVDINYPAGSKISLSNIETLDGGDAAAEQARRFGVISSAMGSSIVSQDRDSNAPIRYIIAGDVSKMSAPEKNMLVAYAEFIKAKPKIVWPNAIPTNGDMLKSIEPIVGIAGMISSNVSGIVTNVSNTPAIVELPSTVDQTKYATYSNLTGPGNRIDTNKKITLQAYETVSFYIAPGPSALQVGTTTPGTTIVPTVPGGGATPFPTLPSGVGQGQLICDPGDDPYNSNTIKITNNTDKAIEELNAVVFRCKYIPDKIRKGFYKCETCTDSDEVNNPDCQAGTFDGAASSDFSIAAGETKTVSVPINPCEIVQLDIANNEVHQDDSVYECFNARSKFTNPEAPARWQGGIGFAIGQNATGYDASTGTCTAPTATPTTPVDTPTNSPTPTVPEASGTPTMTPTVTITPTVTLTPTPLPTYTPIPTPTTIPTNTPVPPTPTTLLIATNSPTPITKITVNGQPPGSTPWALISIPFGLILLGLLL